MKTRLDRFVDAILHYRLQQLGVRRFELLMRRSRVIDRASAVFSYPN